MEAGCLAHARRKFDELARANSSPVATQALQRIASLYRIDHEARAMTALDRLQSRPLREQPLWGELQVWMKLKRTRVADGSGIAALRHCGSAGLQPEPLHGVGPLSGRRRRQHRQQPCRAPDATLGDEKTGMTLLRPRTGRPTGRDGDEPGAVGQAQWARPWAYLKDVLERWLAYPNSRINELLPHHRGRDGGRQNSGA